MPTSWKKAILLPLSMNDVPGRIILLNEDDCERIDISLLRFCAKQLLILLSKSMLVASRTALAKPVPFA
jgi:hypothetical protein